MDEKTGKCDCGHQHIMGVIFVKNFKYDYLNFFRHPLLVTILFILDSKNSSEQLKSNILQTIQEKLQTLFNQIGKFEDVKKHKLVRFQILNFLSSTRSFYSLVFKFSSPIGLLSCPKKIIKIAMDLAKCKRNFFSRAALISLRNIALSIFNEYLRQYNKFRECDLLLFHIKHILFHTSEHVLSFFLLHITENICSIYIQNCNYLLMLT